MENMAAAMQDNPQKLFKDALHVDLDKSGIEVKKAGDAPTSYVRSSKTDKAEEKFANVKTPDLVNSFENMPSEDELKEMHSRALAQIEQIGRERLGQEQAPIQRSVSSGDVKNMGVDTRLLQKDWERELEKWNRELANKKQQTTQQKNSATTAVSQTAAPRKAK
jgi:hypothetical protein